MVVIALASGDGNLYGEETDSTLKPFVGQYICRKVSGKIYINNTFNEIGLKYFLFCCILIRSFLKLLHLF